MRKSDGSIIFLILIAIFLFGALTYMYLKSSRTTDYLALEEDKAALYAAEILNYAQAVKEGINRIVLLHGYKLYEISADNLNSPTDVMGSPNTTCNSNKCRLFHKEGGAIKMRSLPAKFFDPESQATTDGNFFIRFYAISIPGAGTSQNDLVLAIMGLHKDICNQINLKMAGIPPSTSLVNEGYGDANNFATTLTSFPESSASIAASMYDGKKAFCTGHPTHMQNFYYVLVER